MSLCSYHVFLFPFSFDKKDYPAIVDKAKWDEYEYEHSKNVTAYNQHSYFYEFAEKAMFSQADKGFFESFSYRNVNGSTYNIKIEKYKIEYILEIEKIKINLYHSFNCGVLAFYLKNNQTSLKEDILRINDFGRRIYPQFLSDEILVKETKKCFLASKIEIKGILKDSIITNFSEFENRPFPLNWLPQHITHFIGNKVKVVLDDRMFVCCLYNQQNYIDNLKINDVVNNEYSYSNDDFWYEYIFIDNGSKTCFSKKMMPKLLNDATNDRWIDLEFDQQTSGTLYGITRYSFMILGSDYTLKDLKNLYSEMAMLCLIQRACILNFSNQVTNISKEGISSEEVSSLYKNYIEFRNRLYFREITTQEQGIELYDLLQVQMRLGRDVKDLDEEISELNQFVNAAEQNKLTLEQANLALEQGKLSKIASYFLPSSLIVGIMALISDKNLFESKNWNFGAIAMFLIFLMIIAFTIIKSDWLINQINRFKNKFQK